MKIIIASGYENLLKKIFSIVKRSFPTSNILLDISGSGNIIIFTQDLSKRTLLIMGNDFSTPKIIGLISSYPKLSRIPCTSIIPNTSGENRHLHQNFFKKDISPHKKWTVNRPKKRY